MNEVTNVTPIRPEDTLNAEIIAAIDGAESSFTESAAVVKRAALPEAHETIDAMCRAHERLCALATTLVRA